MAPFCCDVDCNTLVLVGLAQVLVLIDLDASQKESPWMSWLKMQLLLLPAQTQDTAVTSCCWRIYLFRRSVVDEG